MNGFVDGCQRKRGGVRHRDCKEQPKKLRISHAVQNTSPGRITNYGFHCASLRRTCNVRALRHMNSVCCFHTTRSWEKCEKKWLRFLKGQPVRVSSESEVEKVK